MMQCPKCKSEDTEYLGRRGKRDEIYCFQCKKTSRVEVSVKPEMKMRVEPRIKERLTWAIAYLLEQDPRWPKTLRRPTMEEAIAIAQLAVVSVSVFAEWVEELMKVEVDRAMTDLGKKEIKNDKTTDPDSGGGGTGGSGLG